MGTLWNHWFWITLGVGVLVTLVSHSSGESLIEPEALDETLFISLPAGARGGKVLVIPEQPNLELNPLWLRERIPKARQGPHVSVSKSVSKVSVKMGDVSEAGYRSLKKISDIYVDHGISNKVETNRPQALHIDPQFISYNLVYRDPEEEKPEPKPSGLLQTIIAKLKSLAQATTSRIRMSSNLLGGDRFSFPEDQDTSTPDTSEPAPGQISTTPIQPVIFNRETESDNISILVDDLKVSAGESNPTHGTEIYDEINETDEPSSRIDIKPLSGSGVGGKGEERPRSLDARGRSLPLHILEDLEIQSLERRLREKTERTANVVIKEIQGAEWEAEQLGEIVEQNHREAESKAEDLIQSQGDFNFDFSAEKIFTADDEELRIEGERIDATNISAIVGVVVGIVIFIIISIVLVLLGVQRSKTKKNEKQDDVISQASYMTYSTTVSDTSVNYGPNWDKDMVEDLCSLDNDSFLNSLEAVTTTDYWGEPKY